VEKFKAAKGTSKSIAFYDLALLTDLAQLYRELARRRLEQAAADPRVKPTAEYYLAEALSGLGEHDAATAVGQAFLARPQAPEQYRNRARARLALVAYRQEKKAEAERTWTAMAEASSDPEVLAAIVLGCADAQAQCAKALARAGQVAESGDARRQQQLGSALGTYYLRRQDYARAIAYMEAGRDKSNKNKIEANDPVMLAGLAEAYYRTKKFSEGLEIFFEMSQEFAAVRQIQEAVQGVYSMEQRSAGDVRIL
jgi:tetratricopeptide (TPR) repeat protein